MSKKWYEDSVVIGNTAAKIIREIANRDGLNMPEAATQCALIGADFLLSPYWGELISEYYKQTNSFNWNGFLDWSYERCQLKR